MEKRKIGSLKISVVGRGCNNFGWRLDNGIISFDTANSPSAGC